MPDSKIEFTKVVQTCLACPSQWDAWDVNGTYYYIRYRWGYLRVDRGEVGGETVYAEDIGDGMDGFITLERVLELTGITLHPEAEVEHA